MLSPGRATRSYQPSKPAATADYEFFALFGENHGETTLRKSWRRQSDRVMGATVP